MKSNFPYDSIEDAAEFLQVLREKSGLTQKEVAERMGSSAAYISHVETGLRKPTTEWLAKYCAAAGYKLKIKVEKKR